MVDAYLEAPDGFDTLIRDALNSAARGKLHSAPANVIVANVRRGDHLRAQQLSELGRGPRKTGWRFVRGSHSGTFVADPDGTDVLPEGYV